jgi:hypothetical protein
MLIGRGCFIAMISRRLASTFHARAADPRQIARRLLKPV